MLWLLRLLGIARKAAQALFALVMRYPLQAALIASLCASLWLWQGKREAVKRADAEHAGRVADRAAYTEAQRQAAILARQAREAQERRYAEQAEKADHDHELALADAMGRADRFIAAHRVRTAGAVARPASDPGSAAEGHRPESGDGPGAAPELVAVTPDDVRICTANTTRLEAVREWALGL